MQDPTSAVFQQLKKQPPPGGPGTVQFPEQEQLKCPRCYSTNTKFCYYNNYNLSQPRHFCKDCRRYWTKGGTLRNIPVGGGSRKNSSSSSSTGKRSSSSFTSSNNSSSSPSLSSKRGNPDPNSNSDTTRSTRRNVSEPAITTASASGAATEGAAKKVLDIGSSRSAQDVTRVFGLESAVGGGVFSFSSLLTSSGQLGSVFEGLVPNGPGHLGAKVDQSGGGGGSCGLVEDLNSDLVSGSGSDPNLRVGDGGGNGNNGSSGGEEGSLQSEEWGNSNGWPDLAIYTPGSDFY